MNRNFALSLCIACGCSGAAFADDITIDPNPFVSTMTRAQVREDLRQFQASGTNPWADDYNQLAGLSGSATRAEARADSSPRARWWPRSRARTAGPATWRR